MEIMAESGGGNGGEGYDWVDLLEWMGWMRLFESTKMLVTELKGRRLREPLLHEYLTKIRYEVRI